MDNISHCIFDCDGVILDTERIYFACLDEFAFRFGVRFSLDLKADMMGRKSEESMGIFLKRMNITTMKCDEALKEVEKLLEKKLPNCELCPGAQEVVSHLHSKGVPIAVATGSNNLHFELKTTNHKVLFAMFDHIVMSDDPELENAKPAPDIYLLTMSRFKNPPKSPGNVLVFEDAVNGIKSALAAGMRTVLVPSVPMYLYDGVIEKTDAVVKTLKDFNPFKITCR